MVPQGWLFPGRSATDPISTRQINRAIHEAAEAAGIRKPVSPHTLRHSFATHLPEQDVDIRVIRVLLGHSKLDTTVLHARVATKTIRSVTSPLEHLAALMRGDRLETIGSVTMFIATSWTSQCAPFVRQPSRRVPRGCDRGGHLVSVHVWRGPTSQNPTRCDSSRSLVRLGR